MNNEDKIIEMLQLVQKDISGIKLDVTNIKDELIEVKHEVTKVQMHLENITDKNISLLMEQYNPNVDKLNQIVDKTEELQFDVGSLKRVVISHSNDINRLMKK